MNKYENVVLVDPKLDEEVLSKVIDKFTKLINKHGKVFSVENVGLKELAYEIQKNKEAYYVIFTFESDPNFIEELQRNYRISDEILKFLVVRIDEIIVKETVEKKTEVKAETEVKEEVKTEEPVETTVEKPVKAEAEVKEEAKTEKKAEVKEKAKTEEKVEVKEETKVEEPVEVEKETKVEAKEEKTEVKAVAEVEEKEEKSKK